MHRVHKQIKGVTAIEVLVVVVLLALLLAVLGPALPRAREQSKVANCLANLRFISQSASSYMTEQGTIAFAFPWDVRFGDYSPNFSFATEFSWGGGVPDKRGSEWGATWGPNPVSGRTDVYVITPADRPLNEYMVPGVWWTHPLRLKGNPERYQIPMELPEFFKCPSDAWAMPPEFGSDPNAPPDPDNPSWAWWGTSYAMNWYWAYFYSEDTGETFIGRTDSPGILDGSRHREIIQSKFERGASEWVLFYENALNFRFEGVRPRGGGEPLPDLPGWHGHRNVHAAGFADGSARYRRFENEYVDGPGWTLWPNRPWDGTPWEDDQEY